ncbi:MAG: hypothetical protein H8E17_00850 [Deltaproteobacteria bacterium]|nr:hypothetical protein [Deltaproteobacteria bacterium]
MVLSFLAFDQSGIIKKQAGNHKILGLGRDFKASVLLAYFALTRKTSMERDRNSSCAREKRSSMSEYPLAINSVWFQEPVSLSILVND